MNDSTKRHQLSQADIDVLRDALIHFQAEVREQIRRSHSQADNAAVSKSTSADTIYKIDTEVEEKLIEFCEEISREVPLVLVAEGLEDEQGNEASRVFPSGTKENDARVRLIVDPIDGTRGIMYDKRPAWALAAVAPNLGPGTRMRDCVLSVMSELPTSKMGFADVLYAQRGMGVTAHRVDLGTGQKQAMAFRASTAHELRHGFASVSNFFPGTKELASKLMEEIAHTLIGPADVTKAMIFDDQYICTGGQMYELIVGHDRFNCDLRPLFYKINQQPEGLCCHPYDCCAFLIAEEAGVIITDGLGEPFDAPFDTTSACTWAGFANKTIHAQVEPVMKKFFAAHSSIS